MVFDTAEFERKMKKTIEVYSDSLLTIRVGRASAAILNDVNVDYYGVPTPINQVAQISVTDPKTLSITPWDASMVKSIEKAILASDIGLTPQNDGKVLRLFFPPLTEERRKELSKKVSSMGEEAKVSVRNIRRDAVELSKTQKKNGELTEDDQKQAEKAIQDLTDKYVKEVDSVTSAKQTEILSL